MAGPVCGGCGKTLPRARRRGRPARYHGAACRQRARRARLAADPGRADLLGLLDRAGQAVAAARRAALSGDDPGTALAELAAVAELAHSTHAPRDTSATSAAPERPAASVPDKSTVTESVTNIAAPTGAASDAQGRDRRRHGPRRARPGLRDLRHLPRAGR